MRQSLNDPLKIVVDTNLYLSLFVFRSSMLHHIFELVNEEKLTLYTSSKQIKELKKKLIELEVSSEVQEKILFYIHEKALLVDPTIAVDKSRDKEDNFLLELSEFIDAAYLISRDNDVVVLKKWKNTMIIMPEDFLPLLREMNLLE